MNSYRKLLLKNTLIVCLIFSSLFTITFYIEGYHNTKKTYISNSQIYLKNVAENIEKTFYKIQDLMVLFHSNDTFKEYIESSSPSPYSRKMVSKYLFSTITSMPSSNFIINIYHAKDAFMVSNDSVMPLSYFIKSYGLPYYEINEIINTMTEISTPVPHIFFTSANDTDYFIVVLNNNSSFTNPYLIFSVYNVDQLFGELPFDASILISLDNKPVYCINNNFKDEILQKISNGESVFGYNTIAEYSKISTIAGNLKYTIILPQAQYLSYINQHVVFVILSFCLLFVMSFIISQKISNKTYSPIRRLVNQISNIDMDILENEIDTISSAISILSKRNTALSTLVKRNQESLKEKFINDLLQGNLSSEQINYGVETYLPKMEGILPLSIIITDAQDDMSQISFEDHQDTYSFNKIIQTVFEKEFSDSTFFHFTTISPSIYCIVVSNSDMQTLKNRLKVMLLGLESDLNISMSSSISNPISSWEELPFAYLSTYFTHANMKSRKISRTVSTRDELNIPILYSPELDNEIFSHCIRQEKDKLYQSLNYLLAENFTSEETFSNNQSQISVLIYSLCLRIFAYTGIESSVLFGDEYNIYLELKLCKTIQEFKNKLNFIFSNIMEQIQQSQTLDEKEYCDKMLNFIHNNYQKDISLQDLAEYMNMSQAYVSRLFKKLVNCNFKDYLAKIRIDKATKLLIENPKKTVKEISELVGFNNVKPFTNLFTKSVGMTPSEYRRLHDK